MKINITAIILTYNEETNIRACLKSVTDVVSEIFVIDSGSSDRTLDIAKEFNCKIVNHPFENYSSQRNWALQNLPISNNWILNLDADHRLTPEL
ncbi:MAG: glycosyltransferase family 2 protein, partial [Segetibacter sp.]